MQATAANEFADVDNGVAPRQQRVFIARQVRVSAVSSAALSIGP